MSTLSQSLEEKSCFKGPVKETRAKLSLKMACITTAAISTQKIQGHIVI